MTYDILTTTAIVTGIGMCIIEELQNSPESGGVPAKMRTCLMVPGNISWDGCECGQLAQSIQSIFPTRNFPAPANAEPIRAGCGELALGVQVLVSITRCITGLNKAGGPPTCTSLLADAIIQQADAYAVRTAVECCLATLLTARTIFDFRISATTFVGPEGNCAGSELTYTFQIL